MASLYKILKIIKYYLQDRSNMLPLYVLKLEAEEQLDFCMKNNIKNTEQLEDLLFHIESYLDTYGVDEVDIITMEKQRAVERDFIFDLAKNLSIGFKGEQICL